ncbi:hypothetical protein [Gordonia amicalis]|uniref:hypothetical protein n=1 Tax=Gordonia amicalis TaxID=89053 RepID=UPI0002A62E39|nr:hypothetical protein [Gordonia amicalis]MBA5848087.1 hypothetical protein [Gordonia amicalis]MDV7102650.1 hypothetical protein [Gordonia amicalis]MDV7172600.1 hypothetical protein [Gordonia amicalis]NKX76185.1 hypothetical protein [Gordonia amicalis]UKO92198.1 hypothetical protein IHQ52_01815 [Gordonia amicalis]
MPPFPTDRFGLIHRDAALNAGFSDEQLSGATARRELVRLIPGVWTPALDVPTGADSLEKRHRLRALAVATSGPADGHPLSHVSAAALHELPMLHPDLSLVHVTTGRTSGGSIRAHRHLHAAPLEAGEVVEVDVIRVTSIERTAVDVATMSNFDQALVIFDAALREGADQTVMADLLAGRRRRSARNARRALPFANAAAESVGESWGRAQMIDAGLPIPTLQREFVIGGHTYRSDFDWEELLVGEFDGLHKYGRLRSADESATDVVVREKLREDRLRAKGITVVRWTWSTLEKRQLAPLLQPWLAKLGLFAA